MSPRMCLIELPRSPAIVTCFWHSVSTRAAPSVLSQGSSTGRYGPTGWVAPSSSYNQLECAKGRSDRAGDGRAFQIQFQPGSLLPILKDQICQAGHQQSMNEVFFTSSLSSSSAQLTIDLLNKQGLFSRPSCNEC
ncbi:hypothetical protein BJX64DRAFT_75615 [Aspergillus heterothallicus]